MTESKKRQTSLSILEKLRQQGTPAPREEKMESMFDSIAMSGEESGEDEEVPAPEYELESPEETDKRREKEKKKGPNLEPKKVDQFKKGFKSVF